MQVGALKPAQVNALTAEQLIDIDENIKGLTTASVAALNITEIGKTDGLLSKLTPDQMKSLSAKQVAAMPNDVFSNLTSQQITSLSPTAMTGITAGQVSKLATLTPNGLTYLTGPQISSISNTTVVQAIANKFTDAPPIFPTLAQVASFTAAKFNSLTDTTGLEKLTNAQVSKILPSTILNLQSAILDKILLKLSPAQLDSLTGKQLQDLGLMSSLAKITNIKSLNPKAIATLSKDDLLALTKSDLTSLNTQQVQAIPSKQLNFIGAMSDGVSKLKTVIGSLTKTQIVNLAKDFLTAAKLDSAALAALTARRADLTPAQWAIIKP